MSRIRTYERGTPLSAGPVASEASLSSFAGGNALASGRALQAGLDTAAENIDRIAQRNEQVWVNNTVTQARYYWQKSMEERMKNAEPGAPGFVQSVSDDWNKFMDDYLSKAPNSRAGTTLQTHLNNLGLQLQEQAFNFQGQQQLAKITDDMMTAIDTNGAILLRDPSKFDEIYHEQEGYVAGLKGQLPPDKILMLNRRLKELAVTTVEGMAIQNPKAALEALKSGKFDGKIDSLRMAGLMEHLKTKSEAADIEAVYTQGQLFEANLKKLEDEGKPLDGFNPESYYQAFGKPERINVERMKGDEEIELAKLSYEGRNKLFGKSPLEMFQVLESYKPKDNDPNWDAKDKLVKKLALTAAKFQHEMTEDPNGYSRQDKEVQAAYQAASTSGSLDQMYQAIDKSLAAQARMGIAAYDQRVISKQEAISYAKQLSRTDPNNMQNFLSGLANQYGRYYGGVVRAMQDLKPEEGRLDPRYELVALNINEPFTNTLIESIRQKPEALNNALKTDKDRLNLEQQLRSSPTIRNLMAAMSTTTANRAEYLNGLVNGAEAYSKVLLMQGRANNPKDAANQAVETLFGRLYDFSQTNGKTYAINRFARDGRKYGEEDLARIKSNLDGWLEFYAELPTTRFNMAQFPEFSPTMTDETRKELIKSNLLRKGFWSTTPDNRGVELWIDPSGRGNPIPVIDEHGQVITKDFDKLSEQVYNPRKDRKPPTTRQFGDIGG